MMSTTQNTNDHHKIFATFEFTYNEQIFLIEISAPVTWQLDGIRGGYSD